MCASREGSGHDRFRVVRVMSCAMCGARRKQATARCRRPAGWGTLHPGAGRCKLHAGSTVQGTVAAVTELARCYSVDTAPAGSLQKGTQETITVRRSKTDREGEGTARYVGPATVARIRAWLEAAAITEGAMFQRLDKAGKPRGRLSAQSVRAIIRQRSGSDPPTRASGAASRGTRSESAQRRASQRRARPSSRCKPPERWSSPSMPGRYARGQLATREALARLRYGA